MKNWAFKSQSFVLISYIQTSLSLLEILKILFFFYVYTRIEFKFNRELESLCYLVVA